MGSITRADLNAMEAVFNEARRNRFPQLTERDAHLMAMIDATIHVLNRHGVLAQDWESKIDTGQLDTRTVLSDTRDNSNKEK